MVQANQWSKPKNYREWLIRWNSAEKEGDEDRALSLLHGGTDVPYDDDGGSAISQLGERVRFYLGLIWHSEGSVREKAYEILVHRFLTLLTGTGINEISEARVPRYEILPEAAFLIEEVINLLAEKRERSDDFLGYTRDPYKSDLLRFIEYLARVSGEGHFHPDEKDPFYQFFCRIRENIIRILLKTGDLKLIAEGRVKGSIPILEEEIVEHLWYIYSPKPEGLGLYPTRNRIQEVWSIKENFVKALDELDPKAFRVAVYDYHWKELTFLLMAELLYRNIPHPLEPLEQQS
jgi:hypothetical protein